MIPSVGPTGKLNPYFNLRQLLFDKQEDPWPTESIIDLPTLKELAQSGVGICFLPPHFFGASKDTYPSSLDELDEQERSVEPRSGTNLYHLHNRGISTLRRYLAEISGPDGDGVSYAQAIQLRNLMSNGFSILNINLQNGGFWNNVTTARNMSYSALDESCSDLKECRINYLTARQILEESLIASPDEIKELNSATERLASLIRTHILEKDGGSERFIEKFRLKGLVNGDRAFLQKGGSFGALLRCFLPGIIDEYNEYALEPHEVEQGWWSNKDYCKRQFFRKLCKLDGFKDLLDDYLLLKKKEEKTELDENKREILQLVIKEMSDIIRSQVLKRFNGGLEFLIQNGLHGLIHDREDNFLEKGKSFGAALRYYLPGVIDEKNENALQPHEVEQDWWDDKSYAEIQVFRKLSKSVTGFRVLLDRLLELRSKQGETGLNGDEARELDTVAKKIAGDIQNEILRRFTGGGKGFLERSGLIGLVGCRRGRKFLDMTSSFEALIRCFLPEVARHLGINN